MIKNGADRCRAFRLASWLGGVVLGLGSASVVQAQSAPQVFLHWPGIKGSSVVQGYVGDIPLFSYSQNASHNTLSAVCGPITVTKPIDIASPPLLQLVFTHQITASGVTITFTSGPTTVPYYTVTLDNVYVDSVTQTDPNSSNGITTETVILTASKFSFKSANSAGGAAFNWDCARSHQ